MLFTEVFRPKVMRLGNGFLMLKPELLSFVFKV